MKEAAGRWDQHVWSTAGLEDTPQSRAREQADPESELQMLGTQGCGAPLNTNFWSILWFFSYG